MNDTFLRKIMWLEVSQVLNTILTGILNVKIIKGFFFFFVRFYLDYLNKSYDDFGELFMIAK